MAGGERDARGAEEVRRVARTLAWEGGRLVDRGTGRPVVGVVDCDLLAARLGVRGSPA